MFLHPWIIPLGAVAAALPIAVHFLTKPKPRALPFSAVRFLREIVAERKARHRLRDFVILALRTAAVLLLALAIARPLLTRAQQTRVDENADVIRVVLLDVSQSMGTVHNGVALLERARPIAARQMEQRPGLKANLVLVAAKPRSVFERPSSNFPVLHEELSRATVLPQEAQVQAALNLVAEMFAVPPGERRPRLELVILSDFQRSNWASADFSVLPEETHIGLSSVAAPETMPNLGLLRVATQERPETGREFRIEADVGNYSPTPRTVRLELALGAAAFELQGVCAPFAKTTLSSDVRAPAAGWLAGQARLTDLHDSLAADDVRPFAVEIRPPAAFALLTRQSANERPSSSYFLERAIAPFDDSAPRSAGSAPNDTVRVARIDPARLDPESLSGVELIVVDHPGRLDDAVIQQLTSLLRRGRAVLYVAAEATDASNLQQLIAATDGRLQLPVEFLPPAQNRLRRNLLLTELRSTQPPFQVFGDDLNRLTGPVRISGGLETRLRDGAVADDIYAQLSDRSAFLTFGSSASGRLIVMNGDLETSNLPASPLFVPLMGELVQLLIGRGDAVREAACGESFVVALPPEVDRIDELRIAGPADDASGIGTLTRESSETIWTGEASGPPAVYRIVRNGIPVAALATAIPPSESDLRTLPAEVFRERLAGGRQLEFRVAGRTEPDEQDSLWNWLVVGCICCWLGEIAGIKLFVA